MRVLITAVGHYQDRPSGSAKIAFDEAVELAHRGMDTWVLAQGPPSLPEYELYRGVHLLRYIPAKVTDWNPSRAFTHQKAVSQVLSRYLPRADAIQGHIPLAHLEALDFYGNSILSSYTIHSPTKMEMAIEWRNASFARRLMAPVGLAIINRIEAECLRRSNVTTALSQYTINCIRKIHGEDLAKKIRLIPGWADTNRFAPLSDRLRAKRELGWATDCPVLFTLRRLVPRMGLDRLLNATRQLFTDGFKFQLVIGGDGPLRGELEEQTRVLGLAKSVTFLGRLEDQVLPKAFAACDAFVLPTAELECFGIIALEALAAGRPVLATPVGAIPEIIRKIEPSWLTASPKAEDIAALIRRYLMGRLPEHTPTQLHDLVHRDYNRERILSDFIEATLGRNNHR